MSSRNIEIETIRNSGEFDEVWYLDRYPDAARLQMDPVRHYVVIGALLGRDPSMVFKTEYYLESNPDVASADVNPFYHFLATGRSEGRQPRPPSLSRSAAEPASIWAGNPQFRVDRNASVSAGQDWLIFVAYSADGRLSACQTYQIRSFREAGYAIALVVNTDNFSNQTDPAAGDVAIQIVRENIGFDFGAWRHAVELIGGLPAARSVTFTNDSIYPATGAGSIPALRSAIASTVTDIVFLTENFEVRRHSQSYLFSFSHQSLQRGALDAVARVPYYLDKTALIGNVELHFADWLSAAGFSICHLYEMPGVEDNPTIHHWERLLDSGCPFVKIQLITAGIIDIDDPRLRARLDAAAHGWLGEHCRQRGLTPSSLVCNRNSPLVPALAVTGLFNEYGAQQAWNLPAEQNPTIHLPLSNLPDVRRSVPQILAVIHGFYTDISAVILDEIALLDIPLRLLITTDTIAKVAAIEAQLAQRNLEGDVVLCPNRGRDVAPFLIEGGKRLGDAEVILHLHTKKSPHDSVYSGWGEFLRKNLIGSRALVVSILQILTETDVGLIYSDHFSQVVGLRNWGYDFPHARKILGEIGITIDGAMPLEFPTSTMFWARREALAPLFAAGLDYTDFEDEAGQIDGTLAHAIERSLLHVVEHGGYSYAKVTALDQPAEALSPLRRLSASGLRYAFDRPMPLLNRGPSLQSAFYKEVPEIYPVSVSRSREDRPRLNVLLPTMKPEKVYGGITTALKVVREVADALPSAIDIRILITSDTVNRESVDELTRRLGRSFSWVMPDDDVNGNTVVGIAENQNIPITLRAREMYIATAWWTADLGFRLVDQQQRLFLRKSRLAYIIQDYEPGFYNWSTTFALAEATYHRGAETIAIINSEELAGFMVSRYSFAEASCIPYELHPQLAALIKPTIPEKLILAYGRPGVSRNCFELICEGLSIWQARNPQENAGYRIVFAGEDFDEARIAHLANATNVGKLPIESYAEVLNRAAIGVSLMVSPHPSYPPLEMASAGCITITNGYEGKDLRQRSDNFISMPSLAPATLADALDAAIQRVQLSRPGRICEIKDLPTGLPIADFSAIARGLLDSVAA